VVGLPRQLAVSARGPLVARLSLAATVLSLVLGIAWLLARFDFPGLRLVRALVLPMVLPPVVGGVALLLAFGRRPARPVARARTAWLAVRRRARCWPRPSWPCRSRRRGEGPSAVDRRLEEAAAVLGAQPGFALRRITLPLAAPALRAGAALCWARALGEFGATITFAGNFPGRTQTLPLAVYIALEHDPDAAIALSLVLLAVSIVALVALRDRWLDDE
jgi:molybdate transport system permease protein